MVKVEALLVEILNCKLELRTGVVRVGEEEGGW